MEVYRTKVPKLPGSSYPEIIKRANIVYKEIKSKSKRRPYLKSAFFGNKKVFLELFWIHLYQKSWRDRKNRLKFFAAAMDLIEHSRCEPLIKNNSKNSSEIFYRFAGMSRERQIFYVQIKEDRNRGEKWLMSIFPDAK